MQDHQDEEPSAGHGSLASGETTSATVLLLLMGHLSRSLSLDYSMPVLPTRLVVVLSLQV